MLWSGYKLNEITEMKVHEFHWFLVMMLDNKKVKAEQYQKGKGKNVTRL